MATPYIKNDGVNYKIQAGLPSAGVATLQFTDSASSPVVTVPNLTGTMALTTIATGTNALVTTDMAAGFRALDGLVMPNVLGYLTNTPPVSPANGDCYIVGAAPTGAWVGQGGKVARYSTVAATWEFYTPKNGWMIGANTAREIYRYTASAWEIFYQEGAWTPTLYGGTTTGSTTYSIQDGVFKKIGNVITVVAFVQITAKTGTGAATIGGLPFASRLTYCGFYANFYSGVTITGKSIGLMTSGSSTTITIYDNPGAVVDMSSVSASADVRFSGSYII